MYRSSHLQLPTASETAAGTPVSGKQSLSGKRSLNPLQTLALGIGASFLCFSPSAQAVERVTLTYGEKQISIPVSELDNFIQKGTISDELDLFFKTPGVIRSEVSELLVRPITIGSDFEKALDTTTGRFVLLKLNQLIDASPNKDDIQAIQTALKSSISDSSFTVLELVEAFPEKEVKLNLSGLQTVYNQVSRFVERIQPALEVVRSFLSDVVCDCPQSTAATDGATPLAARGSDASRTGTKTGNKTCNPSSAATTAPTVETEPSAELTPPVAPLHTLGR